MQYQSMNIFVRHPKFIGRKTTTIQNKQEKAKMEAQRTELRTTRQWKLRTAYKRCTLACFYNHSIPGLFKETQPSKRL